MAPETRFAGTTDGLHIAYQVTGSGPVDMVLLRGWFSDMEFEWQEPGLARFYRRLESMVRAVMDAAGSPQAVLCGLGDGATDAVLFAATHPERVRGLVLYAPFLRSRRGDDYTWGLTEEEHAQNLATLRQGLRRLFGSEVSAR